MSDDEPDLNLRPYQMRLVELCKKQNSIIWLGTGMGKTYVAVELIKLHLDLTKLPLNEGGKRIVFLAPTVPLVRQQAAVITRFTAASVTKCSGVDGVDKWARSKWRQEFDNHAVIVMTPAVLRDCLQKLSVSMKEIGLIIFDECHHSVGDDMYVQIMKDYVKDSGPLVLAMTATLINSKIQMSQFNASFKDEMCLKLQKHIDQLCSTLKCSIQTTEDPREYNALGANPHIEFRGFNDFDFLSIKLEIAKYLDEFKVLQNFSSNSKVLDRFVKILRQCEQAAVDLGPLGVCYILDRYEKAQEFRIHLSVFESAQSRKCLDACQKLKAFVEEQQISLGCEISSKAQCLVACLWEFSERFSGKPKPEPETSEDLALQSTLTSFDFEDEFLEFWLGLMAEDEDALEIADKGTKEEAKVTNEPKQNAKKDLIQKVYDKIEQIHDPNRVDILEDSGISSFLRTPSPSPLDLDQKEMTKISARSGLCCVVFVEKRLVCAALAHILLKASEDPDSDLYGLISVDYVVGQNGNMWGNVYNRESEIDALSSLEAKMTEKRQDAVLAKFRIGLLNVIVATNVLEEGLDVPQCNLIVMFDMPKTPKAYIQSKGRGRAAGAHYVLLIPEAKQELMTDTFKHFRLTEKLMMEKYFKFMEDLNVNQKIPSQRRDELVSPFCPHGPDGQRIDRLRAVELLNRYVAKIGFPVLDVTWDKREFVADDANANVSYKYKATIKMPSLSGITHPVTHSAWLPSKKLANQAAALEACKLLYEKGEIRLDGIPTCEESAKPIVENESILVEKSSKHDGTNKSVQVIKRPRPKWLSEDASLTPKSDMLLYDFWLKFENIVTRDQDRLLEMVKQSGSSFGLLSPVKLDDSLPEFRLYPRKHEVIAKISEIESISLDAIQLEKLTKFYRFLIENLLFKLNDDPKLEFSIGESLLPVLIVPLSNSKIDWKAVENVCLGQDFDKTPTASADQACIPTQALIDCRTSMANAKSMIVLVEVSQHLTASSIREYDTLSHAAFFQKRGLAITNLSQNLVYGVPLSTHLNHFSRHQLKMTGNAATRNTGAYYIPETLIRLPISGCLAALSCYLPSLIYRIYQLWLVKDVQSAICSEMDLKIDNRLEETCVGERGVVSDYFGNNNSFEVVETSSPQRTKPNLFRMLPGKPLQLSISDLLDSVKEKLSPIVLKFQCSSCQYFLNVHIPWILNNYILIKSNETSSKFAYKCRACQKCDLDFESTPFDLLCHILANHLRLLASDNNVWPAFTDETCQICRLFFETQEEIQAKYCQFIEDGLDINFEICNSRCQKGCLCTVRSQIATPPEEICHRDDSFNAPTLAQFFQVLLSIRARDIFDNERFELLGDIFLKYAITTYLFVKYPQSCQGQLTFVKGRLVSNLNLKNWSARWKCIDLMSYPFLTAFDPLINWLPPCYKDLSISNSRSCQIVADKVVADTVEALLGLFLATCGPRIALKFLHLFGIKFSNMPAEDDPNNSNSDFGSWVHLLNLSQLPSNEEIEGEWIQRRFDEVEHLLGYHFKHRSLLLQAFRHSSATEGRLPSYERLELLGDALIDYLVTACLFTKSSSLKPGMLSTIRMSIVNNDVLGEICVLHKFHTKINASPAVMSSIGAFVNDFVSDPANSENGGQPVIRTCPYRNCGQWAEAVEVPKVLGDILESIAGAVFVDCGLDIKIFWAVFEPLLHQTIENFVDAKPCQPVRELYERVSQLHTNIRFDKPPSHFHLPPMQNGGPHNGIVVSVYIGDQALPAGTGRGANGKLAKQAAANMALYHLNAELPPVPWRN